MYVGLSAALLRSGREYIYNPSVIYMNNLFFKKINPFKYFLFLPPSDLNT